jgi:hypothetical protein
MAIMELQAGGAETAFEGLGRARGRQGFAAQAQQGEREDECESTQAG